MLSLTALLILGAAIAADQHPVITVDYAHPTADKPQSKVWYAADRWWALLPRSAGPSLWERTEDGWTEHSDITEALRGLPGRADVWFEGDTATAVAVKALNKSNPTMTVFQLKRIADADPPRWTPRVLAELAPSQTAALIETATITHDSAGRWWVAAVADTAVCVWHGAADGASWTGPIVLAEGLHDDDICVVTPLPDEAVGVLWSNQNTDTIALRAHPDGATPETWGPEEIAAAGGLTADDHLNTCLTPDGTLWVATKNSLDATDEPQFVLRKRTRDGVWSNWPYGIRHESTRPSRPIVVASTDGTTLLTGYGDNDRSVPSPHDARIVFHQVDDGEAVAIGAPTTVLSPAPGLKSFLQNVTGPRHPYPAQGMWLILASDSQGCVYEADLRGMVQE